LHAAPIVSASDAHERGLAKELFSMTSRHRADDIHVHDDSSRKKVTPANRGGHMSDGKNVRAGYVRDLMWYRMAKEGRVTRRPSPPGIPALVETKTELICTLLSFLFVRRMHRAPP
jgi:hypothetical protein